MHRPPLRKGARQQVLASSSAGVAQVHPETSTMHMVVLAIANGVLQDPTCPDSCPKPSSKHHMDLHVRGPNSELSNGWYPIHGPASASAWRLPRAWWRWGRFFSRHGPAPPLCTIAEGAGGMVWAHQAASFMHSMAKSGHERSKVLTLALGWSYVPRTVRVRPSAAELSRPYPSWRGEARSGAAASMNEFHAHTLMCSLNE